MWHIVGNSIQTGIILFIVVTHNSSESLVNQWFYHSCGRLYSRLIRVLIRCLVNIKHLLLQSFHMIVFPQKIRFIPTFYHLQHFFSCFSHQFKLTQPRSNFGNQRFVFRIGQQYISGLFHTLESIPEGFEIRLIIAAVFFKTFKETIGGRLNVLRFFTTVAMSVRS